MLAYFVCALLGFCTHKFTTKSEKNGTFLLTEGYMLYEKLGVTGILQLSQRNGKLPLPQ